MATNENETSGDDEGGAGKRERSPNYPALTFTAALERTKTIWDKEKRAHVGNEVAARHLGYKTMNGAAFQTLGALKRYGLVVSTGKKKDIRVSDDAHFIFVHPEAHPDRIKMMGKLAMSPGLFSKILGAFSGDLPSDENLVAKLQTDEWGFKSEEAAKAVARALRDAVRVSNESGVAWDNTTRNNGEVIAETNQPAAGSQLMKALIPAAPTPPPTPGSQTGAISRQWEIGEGRFASVSLPPNSTVGDVEILEEFLGLLKQELTLVWKRKIRQPTEEKTSE